MRTILMLSPMVLACSTAPVAAAPLPDLKALVASVNGEYLSYSRDRGSRRVVEATSNFRTGDTRFALGFGAGERKSDQGRFKSARVSASLSHEWTDRISTRTAASLAENKPVFVNRELLQEVSFKATPETVLTVGGRYGRYYSGVEAWSWSAGAAKYWRGGLVSYRFSRYKIEHLGHSVGHLVTLKLDDGSGSNQLWLGHGNSIQDADWLDEPAKGKFTSVEFARVQRIGGGLAFKAGVKRAWYDKPSGDYRGTGVQFGLVYGR